MNLAVVMALFGVLVAGSTRAEEPPSASAHETVPRTFDRAGAAFKRGGQEIGDGFRGIGRGLKGTFTGQRSADDYRKGKRIGTGFADLGRGVAGSARALGREIKKSVKGGGEDGE